MANYSVVRCLRAQKDGRGNGESMPEAVATGSEYIASGAQSSQMVSDQEYWVVTAVGGSGWAKFGTNPTAAQADQWFLPEGIPQAFSGAIAQRCSVLDHV